MQADSPCSVLVMSNDRELRRMVVDTTDRWKSTVTCVENRDDLLDEKLFNQVVTAIIDLEPESVNQTELIQKIVEQRPDVRIIAIIEQGNVDAAIQSMKFGAIDVIQKPITPKRIADAIATALAWRKTQVLDYTVRVSLARRDVSAGHLAAALAHLHIAIAEDPARPDAFNLLGAIHEIDGNRYDAMKNYRIALDLDPTYAPARYNLLRDTSVHRAAKLDLGQYGNPGEETVLDGELSPPRLLLPERMRESCSEKSACGGW